MKKVKVQDKGGRPPKPDEVRLVQRSIRLTGVQWEKYDAEGGIEWLRKLIDRARTSSKAS